VVQHQAGLTLGDEPLVPGDLLLAVVDHQLGRCSMTRTVRPISRTGAE
jgi:hypothetical protein